MVGELHQRGADLRRLDTAMATWQDRITSRLPRQGRWGRVPAASWARWHGNHRTGDLRRALTAATEECWTDPVRAGRASRAERATALVPRDRQACPSPGHGSSPGRRPCPLGRRSVLPSNGRPVRGTAAGARNRLVTSAGPRHRGSLANRSSDLSDCRRARWT